MTPDSNIPAAVPQIDIRPCALCHTNETGFVCTGACEEYDEPECPRCHGDGMDPWNDYLFACPLCQGEQRP